MRSAHDLPCAAVDYDCGFRSKVERDLVVFKEKVKKTETEVARLTEQVTEYKKKHGKYARHFVTILSSSANTTNAFRLSLVRYS